MKILLIHPRDASYRYRGLLRHQPSYAPLTLATLAPRELEVEIRIIDEGVEQVSRNSCRFCVVPPLYRKILHQLERLGFDGWIHLSLMAEPLTDPRIVKLTALDLALDHSAEAA